MKIERMKGAIYALSGLVFVGGMILYLASYFIGLLPMVLGIAILGIYTAAAHSRAELVDKLRARTDVTPD